MQARTRTFRQKIALFLWSTFVKTSKDSRIWWREISHTGSDSTNFTNAASPFNSGLHSCPTDEFGVQRSFPFFPQRNERTSHRSLYEHEKRTVFLRSQGVGDYLCSCTCVNERSISGSAIRRGK